MKRIIDIPEETYNQIINFYQGSKARPKDYEIAILNSIPLEQETVPDRVRSEIESKITKRPGLNFTLRERERNDAFLEVLDIIDKYKAESEDKESIEKESIPYLMHKEMSIPISECQEAYDVAIEYLRSQGKLKG